MSYFIEKTKSRTTPSGQIKWKANFKCHICKNVFEREYGAIHKLVNIDCGCVRYTRVNQPHWDDLKKRYSGIKSRCSNCNRIRHSYSKCYENVEMCIEWIESFNSFYNWAIKNGFETNLHIDRIDSNIGYFPSNCRWVTQQQNNRNGARSKLTEIEVIEILKLHGEYCNLDIAKKFNVTPAIICNIAKGRIWKDIWGKYHTAKNIKRAHPLDLKRLHNA